MKNLSETINLIDKYLYEKYFLNKENGIYIDIGIKDGNNSISYFFQKYHNWNGILLESNPHYIPTLLKNRKNNTIINGSIGYQYDIKPFYDYTFDNKLIHTNIQNVIPTQIHPYQSIINKKFPDLIIINDQGNQLEILETICESHYKPQILLIEYNYLNKQKIKDYCSKYFTFKEQKDNYFIFKKKYEILLITRCTRIHNLPYLKKSIEENFNDIDLNYNWYIIVDQNKVNIFNYQIYKKKFKNNQNIIIKYIASDKHYLYSAEFLNKALYDQKMNNVDYSFVLDDDNILHPNFTKCIYEYIQNHKEVIVINIQNYLGDIYQLTTNCRGKIDFANFLIRTDILKSVDGYSMTPYFIKEGWGEDALTFKKLLENNIPITYTHKYCSYYNHLKNK